MLMNLNGNNILIKHIVNYYNKSNNSKYMQTIQKCWDYIEIRLYKYGAINGNKCQLLGHRLIENKCFHLNQLF